MGVNSICPMNLGVFLEFIKHDLKYRTAMNKNISMGSFSFTKAAYNEASVAKTFKFSFFFIIKMSRLYWQTNLNNFFSTTVKITFLCRDRPVCHPCFLSFLSLERNRPALERTGTKQLSSV